MSTKPTALVTGASRGVGRGIAIALHDAGFEVYATGRRAASADLPDGIGRIALDQLDDLHTAEAFERVMRETGRLDVLVNSAWGGYERMVEDGAFTWGLPFWRQPMHRWSAMMDVGVRAAFVASAHAARIMTGQRSGLIVNISFWAAQKRVGNALYGIAKAATDKLTADCAQELAPFGVTCVSLYPGMVRTESVMAAAKGGAFSLEGSESPEFQGRVIAGLFADPERMAKSGKALVSAQLARDYGITDIDGASPPVLSLETLPG